MYILHVAFSSDCQEGGYYRILAGVLRGITRDTGYFAGYGILRGIRDTLRDTGYSAGYGILSRVTRGGQRDTQKDTSAGLRILKRILREHGGIHGILRNTRFW